MAFGAEKRRSAINGGSQQYSPHDKNKATTNSRKPPYFCDNCKIHGLSIARCFKLHGYPNKPKPTSTNPYAATASGLDSSCSPQDGASFGLSNEQFNNLLSFFEKQNVDRHTDDNLVMDSSVHLAGTCLTSKTSPPI